MDPWDQFTEIVATSIGKEDEIGPNQSINLQSSFIHAGGTSLNAVETVLRLQQAGCPITVQQLLEAESLATLLADLRTKNCSNDPSTKPQRSGATTVDDGGEWVGGLRARPLATVDRDEALRLVIRCFTERSETFGGYSQEDKDELYEFLVEIWDASLGVAVVDRAGCVRDLRLFHCQSKVDTFLNQFFCQFRIISIEISNIKTLWGICFLFRLKIVPFKFFQSDFRNLRKSNLTIRYFDPSENWISNAQITFRDFTKNQGNKIFRNDSRFPDAFVDEALRVRTGRLLNIRTTLKLGQGNVCARIVSESSFYIENFSFKIISKKSDLKILRNDDPVGLRLNRVKSGQPSSAKCVFHKSFKYTSYMCLNCKLFFPCVCKWNESEKKLFERVFNRN